MNAYDFKIEPKRVEDFGIATVQVFEHRFEQLPLMAQKWFLTFARLSTDLTIQISGKGKILTFEIPNYRLDEFFEKLKEEGIR